LPVCIQLALLPMHDPAGTSNGFLKPLLRLLDLPHYIHLDAKNHAEGDSSMCQLPTQSGRQA
jgi:hypothetical protein